MLSEQLKNLLEGRQIKWVAEKAGISRSKIYKILNGGNVSFDLLSKIALACDKKLEIRFISESSPQEKAS